MKPFRPATGTLEEWNAAHYRLEDYLRAHGLSDRAWQSQLVLQLLERAALKHAADTSQSPTQLVIADAEQALTAWFQCLLGLTDSPTVRVNSVGRVCLYLTDAMQRWPQAFLSEGEWPAEFEAEMRCVSVASGPDFRITSMTPRPLDDATPGELLGDVWDGFFKTVLASGMAVTAFLGLLWLFR